ncbi:hypothetical protein [Paenibacillus caui]|uniref:hypothetical protein n=1 Tax=Paenibacillus caui TaxID=2873927 RepID=UPI001CA9433B|nr:hypothetical protein [Paenibacillus caui]
MPGLSQSKNGNKPQTTERESITEPLIIAEQQEGYVDEHLRPLQQIEGGGGPKKINLESMPKPTRYLGYIFLYIIPVLLIILVMISFIR